MKVRRHDVLRLDKVLRTPEGYLDASGNLTKCGVFQYTNSDGSSRLELRLPEHVFEETSVKSFDGKPLTLFHPPVSLDAGNVSQYITGVVVGPHKSEDGEHMRARILVHRKDAIDAIDSGIRELSNGYDTTLVPIPGGVYKMPDGKEIKADFLQTKIEGNHIAIVPKGRAGSTARLDAADNQIEEEKEDTMDLKEALAEIANLKAKIASDTKANQDASEAEAERLRGENETLKTQIKKQEEDRAKERKDALLERVAPLTKKTVNDLSTLDEDALMREALKVTSPELKTDSWTSAKLQGAFEMAMVEESKRNDSASAAAKVVAGIKESEKQDAVDEHASEKAYREGHKALANAWKTPLGPQPRK